MRFESQHQHCIDQVLLIDRLLKKTHPTTADVMFLLGHLSTQGMDAFEPVYKNAIAAAKRRSQKEFMRTRKKDWLAIRQFKNFKRNFSNKALVRDLYSIDKKYFYRGKTQPEKLLIVFTTMYNSFVMSNVALLSFLQEFGISILILKDSSIFNYLNGIPGFGTDFPNSIENLKTFIEKEEFENVYISGFSSSGYASLLASCLLPCDGYLGFAIKSDLSAGSSMDPGKHFTERARSSIQPELLKNLAGPVAANSTTRYKIFYGSLSPTDTAHATNLSDCGNVDVEVVAGAPHAVISALLISGQLKKEFRALISAT